jgi:hypothetical protein
MAVARVVHGELVGGLGVGGNSFSSIAWTGSVEGDLRVEVGDRGGRRRRGYFGGGAGSFGDRDLKRCRGLRIAGTEQRTPGSRVWAVAQLSNRGLEDGGRRLFRAVVAFPKAVDAASEGVAGVLPRLHGGARIVRLSSGTSKWG